MTWYYYGLIWFDRFPAFSMRTPAWTALLWWTDVNGEQPLLRKTSRLAGSRCESMSSQFWLNMLWHICVTIIIHIYDNYKQYVWWVLFILFIKPSTEDNRGWSEMMWDGWLETTNQPSRLFEGTAWAHEPAWRTSHLDNRKGVVRTDRSCCPERGAKPKQGSFSWGFWVRLQPQWWGTVQICWFTWHNGLKFEHLNWSLGHRVMKLWSGVSFDTPRQWNMQKQQPRL